MHERQLCIDVSLPLPLPPFPSKEKGKRKKKWDSNNPKTQLLVHCGTPGSPSSLCDQSLGLTISVCPTSLGARTRFPASLGPQHKPQSRFVWTNTEEPTRGTRKLQGLHDSGCPSAENTGASSHALARGPAWGRSDSFLLLTFFLDSIN